MEEFNLSNSHSFAHTCLEHRSDASRILPLVLEHIRLHCRLSLTAGVHHYRVEYQRAQWSCYIADVPTTARVAAADGLVRLLLYVCIHISFFHCNVKLFFVLTFSSLQGKNADAVESCNTLICDYQKSTVGAYDLLDHFCCAWQSGWFALLLSIALDELKMEMQNIFLRFPALLANSWQSVIHSQCLSADGAILHNGQLCQRHCIQLHWRAAATQLPGVSRRTRKCPALF